MTLLAAVAVDGRRNGEAKGSQATG